MGSPYLLGDGEMMKRHSYFEEIYGVLNALGGLLNNLGGEIEMNNRDWERVAGSVALSRDHASPRLVRHRRSGTVLIPATKQIPPCDEAEKGLCPSPGLYP